MKRYDETTYGQRIADIYDELYGSYDEAAVTTLAELARGGRALELGIGTGRIALPLQEKGVEVHGIDASEAMLSRLRAKKGGQAIPVTLGDFAEVAVDGRFSLVYVVFNTFYALLTQEDQIRCFANVAGRLEEDGLFVLEVFVPDLTRFKSGQTVRASQTDGEMVQLEASMHDPVNQQVVTQHIFLSDQGVRLSPVKIRYVWPPELDLMARLAGLKLAHRWGGWGKEPFSPDSRRYISVYRP